jgi:O-antigen/teichoic acid export membrane protein
MSARAQLVRTFTSNAFGFIVTTIVQFGTVPILLSAWGPTLYGEWLLASTIPGYLAMSDLGLGTALANDMALNAARGDGRAVLAAFQSVGWAIFAIGPLVLLPAGALVAVFPVGPGFGMSAIAGSDLTTLIGLLLAQVWLGQLIAVVQAGFRSAGHLAFPSVAWQILRLAEFGALAVAALTGSGPIGVVAAMVAMRLAGGVITAIILRLWAPWLRFGVAEARFATVGRLLRPAIMFLAFPLANALNLQTPLIVVGAVLGAEATVVFSTARTISRVIQQFPNLVNASVWPVISHAFGEGDMPLVRRIYRFAVAASVWISAAGAFVLAVAGPYLYQLWTRRLVVLDPVLFDILLVGVLVSSLWYTASVLFTSTNRHGGFAMCSLLVNLVVAPLSWALAELAGLRGVAVALVLGEIMIALYVLPASTRLVGDRLGDLARLMISPKTLVQVFSGSWILKRRN